MKTVNVATAWIAGAALLLSTAAQARFLQTDPVGYQDDLNLYAYVNNDPTNRSDPSGRCDICLPVPALGAPVDSQIDISLAQQQGMVGAGVIAAGLVLPGPEDAAIAAAGATKIGGLVGRIVSAINDALKGESKTVTRYMGPQEARVARETGQIPNVGKDGMPRPTHVTTDNPVGSASQAQSKYELPDAPTHRATVPADRVKDIGPTPDGRSTTSGGGSQSATNQPIPVKSCEIKGLGC